MTIEAWVGSALLVLSTLEALTFVAAYHLLTRGAWRGDPMGRHVMAFVAADAAVLTLASVRMVVGAGLDHGWFVWLRVVTFLAIPWVLGWRLAILWSLYRRPKRSGA